MRANSSAMEPLTAQRRLVKSPPELWAEISSEPTLSKHLAEFGEIRITRVDPETTVAWEGDRASGTVELAPAGWGTKVVLTATPVTEEVAAVEPVPEPAPEPDTSDEPDAAAPAPAPAAPIAPARVRRGLLARLLRRWLSPRPADEIPAPGPPVPDPSPPPPAPDPSPPDPGPDPSPTPPPPDPVPPSPEPGPTPPPTIEADGPQPAADAQPPAADAQPPAAELGHDRVVAILTEVLDDLGAAHHRATYFAPLT
jgi:hypothetical protein